MEDTVIEETPRDDEDTKKEKNFEENKFLKYFDGDALRDRIEWYDPDALSAEIRMASSDTTVHICRIMLKQLSYFLLKNRKGPFTRSVWYPKEAREKVAERLYEQGYVVVGEHIDDQIFARNDSLVFLFDNDYMNITSADPNLNEAFFNSIDDLLEVPTKVKDQIYLIQREGGSYYIKPRKLVPRTIEMDNYPESSVEQMEDLFEMVSASDPFGRLAIIEGPPGGGKTSLIRGLLNKYDHAKFVVVPPHMAAALGSPEMNSMIMDEQEDDDRPLIIVLEDADSCLASRMSDNVSSISSVLNLADGALSDTVDVRLIATTNARRGDIDSALERNGRIGAYVQIGKLGNDQAVRVLSRIMEKNEEEARVILHKHCGEGEIMLCDVYAAAHAEKREGRKGKKIKVPPAAGSLGKVGF